MKTIKLLSQSMLGNLSTLQNNDTVVTFQNITGGFKQTRNYFLLLLMIFPLLTLFGNLLVVISVVKERYLRTTTNYYIVSLAVADISLAVSVMPLCMWVEVNRGFWEFSRVFCDIFIMLDVMFCTSSILNLAAISVDRYIAVTKPLFYSNTKQKFQRISASIAATWIISFMIASPIIFGFNKIPSNQPLTQCIFVNPNFIILSSFFSFFLPSFLVLILYYRIFVIIQNQARSKTRRRNITIPSQFHETTAQTNNKINTKNENQDKTAKNNNTLTTASSTKLLIKPANMNSIHSELNTEEDDEITSQLKEKSNSNEMKHLKSSLFVNTFHTANLIKSTIALKLPLINKSRDNQAKLIVKRERKATKTLVIVLVVFMLCWLPFFTLNVINAICIKIQHKPTNSSALLEHSNSSASFICDLPNSAATNISVWLGYINSCVNPIIYTIFNVEFRKAFKKLLCLA